MVTSTSSRFPQRVSCSQCPEFVFPAFDKYKFDSSLQDQSTSVGKFGQKLTTLLGSSGKNVFISPLSIHECLLMAGNGAMGSTLHSMKETLCLPNASSDEPINTLHSMLTAGRQMENRAPLFTMANSLWISDKFPVFAGFLSESESVFDATAKSMDFSKAETVSAINEWVSTNTKGLIKQVVNQLAPDHKMVLVNTVHFQQDFQVKFEQSKTRKQDFTLFDGEKRKVNMMHMKHTLRTCHNSDVSAVCLDFAHPEAMMVLILPNETGQNALLSTAGKYLDPKEFSALVKECTPSRIELHLPKFELECSEELKEPLTALGMGAAFSDAAEFPRISPQPLKIDQVIHKTVLKVAENGVEAAAATAVMMGLLMMPPPEAPVPQLVFDRPFIVALADKRNDLVFFEGLVTSLAL
ncbi:putative Serine protease inhibitor 42Dd [Blattamonas nauphoetae]|uniref:Serine protease inhibitor 42Dd n=1 Tax=Blattamonas nauphoetae TaxID=2049346 RepID=A0ABQ9YBA2_9EUKA|nr:putative Serine protease inhibitor 42Dd [Blattamonas nauphoetae]